MLEKAQQKPSQILLDEPLQEVLRRVHVNMPWKFINRHLEMVLKNKVNLEIGFAASELDQVERSEIVEKGEVLRAAGCFVTLHGPFWDLSPGSSDQLIRQVSLLRFQQLLDLARPLRALQVTFHTGYDPRHHGVRWDTFLDRSLRTWELIVARAEDLGIPVVLENVWEMGPEYHFDLFHRLPSPFLGFCLDVGHQHSFSKTPLRDWIEALSDFLMEIHLHDNHGKEDEHLPVGEGTIDFSLLFAMIEEKTRKPLLTVEPHTEEHFYRTLNGLRRFFD